MSFRIPNAEPQLGGNEWRYLKECLDTGWVSSAGPFVGRFETMVAEYVGSAHAVATTSGTAALHIALLLAGVEPDDEVIVPSLTFVATANAVRYCGAWPVFMDSEPRTFGMDPEKVQEFARTRCELRGGRLVNKGSGRTVRAVLPVHLYGHAADVDPLLDLCRALPMVVVEDAAEALGARYGDRPAGTMGRLGCLSFNGNKIITSGGGGMILTDEPTLADRARYLTAQANEGGHRFIHGAVGYNYRLTNVQAALGLAQLEQIERFIEAKRTTARFYSDALFELGGATPLEEAPSAFATYWMYAVVLDPVRYGDVEQLTARAREEGIELRPFWHPLHRQPIYAACESYAIEVTDRLHATGVCLPCSAGITPEARELVVAFLARAAARR